MRFFARRLPVWPWWLLGLAALAGAGALHALARPDYPRPEDLVTVSGTIETVRVKDDISGTGAGAAMPSLTSVYFTLSGVEGTFRYPSSHPDYPRVRDATAGEVDLLVERDKLGSGQPLIVWGIHERNPINLTAPPTEVAYERVIARLRAIDRSLVVTAVVLGLLGLALIGAGEVVRRRNRRFPPPLP